jgi:hypothetical protein
LSSLVSDTHETVPVGLALRANFEVLQVAHNLAPFVETILTPLHRFFAKGVELGAYIILSHPHLLQPVNHAGQDIRGVAARVEFESRS